jgi:large subunit ribosomal protein L29
MSNKLLEELRDQSVEGLEVQKVEAAKDLFQLRNEVRETKKGVEKPHLFKNLKKKIARINTVLREKQKSA